MTRWLDTWGRGVPEQMAAARCDRQGRLERKSPETGAWERWPVLKIRPPATMNEMLRALGAGQAAGAVPAHVRTP